MKMKKILKMPLRRMARPPSAADSLRAKATASSGTYEKEDYENPEEPNMKFSHALIVVLALHVIAVGGVFAFNSIKAGQAAAAKEEIARAVAQTSSKPKPSPPENAIEGWQGRTHTVQAGDTLSRLAALYKTTIEAIENENGITTYSMIRVGQILKIPALKTEVSKPATDPATAAVKHAFLAAKSDLPKPAATMAAKAEAPKPAPLATPAPKVLTQAAAQKPLAQAATQKSPAQAVTQKSPAQSAVQKSSTQSAAPNKEEVAPTTGDKNTYTVAKGDNPYSIAKKLHVSYNELIAINDIKDPTRVQIGQKLKIPPRKN
jgi:LysM repeat protein